MFRRLDDSLMDQIERTVLAEIRLPQTDVGVEYGIVLEAGRIFARTRDGEARRLILRHLYRRDRPRREVAAALE